MISRSAVRLHKRPVTGWLLGWVAGLWLTSLTTSWGADPRPVWLAGKSFEQQLGAQVGVDWSGIPLREALRNLSRNQRVAIWLDRRIDPDQSIEFSTANVPLQVALQQLALREGCGISVLADIVYVGPASTAERLATVAALRRSDAGDFPAAAKKALLQQRPAHWPELSVPREMLTLMATKAGVQLRGLEQVPHDLWPESDVPSLALIDHLTLVAASFDLTFDMSPSTLELTLVPLPKRISMTRSYSVPGSGTEAVRQIRERFSDIQITPRGGRFEVVGTWEQHQLVAKLLRGEAVERRTVTAGESRFTLRVQQQPVGSVLRSLRDRLMLEVHVSPEAEAEIKKLVSFEIQDGTLEEVLQAALKPAGLTFQLEAKSLSILPAMP